MKPTKKRREDASPRAATFRRPPPSDRGPRLASLARSGNAPERALPPVGDTAVADQILNATLTAIRALADRDWGGIVPPIEAIYASMNVIALAIAPQPVAVSPAGVHALCIDIAGRLQTIVLQQQRAASGRPH